MRSSAGARGRDLAACALGAALVALLGGGLQARAAEGEAPATKTKVVVYKLKAPDDLQAVAQQLSDDLVLHLGKNADLVILGENEIKVMMRHEKDKKVLMCEDQQRCLAQLQAAVQADKVITGHLGKLGDTYVATLKLADTKKAVVESAESAEADKPEALVVALRAAADRLLGIGDTKQVQFQMNIAPEGTKAAVVDLAAVGVDAVVAENLTQLLSLELKKFKGLSVISRDEIQTMLRFEAEKQVLQCKSDTSCLVEIGGALGVDYLISGSIGKLGEAFVVTLKLMDVHAAKVVHRASQSLQGAEADLPLALRFSAWELLGRPLGGTGSLVVKANVEEGTVEYGGEKLKYPLAQPFTGLVAGRHGVSLKAEGYYPLYQETFVLDGQSTNLRMRLTEIPTPWYEQWWPWTILGAVVAGGVVATVLLLPQDSGNGDVLVKINGSASQP
jgi:TolB-like protein